MLKRLLGLGIILDGEGGAKSNSHLYVTIWFDITVGNGLNVFRPP